MSTKKSSSQPKKQQPGSKPSSAPPAGSAQKAAPVPEPSAPEAKRGFMQRMLDGIERVGNRIPHPVLLFLYLIAAVVIVSAVLSAFNVSVTQDVAVPQPPQAEFYNVDSVLPTLEVDAGYTGEEHFAIEQQTITARSLLSIEGIRFIFTSFLPNFAGFTVVAVVLIAMLGVGVAEEAGLMVALIRKLVQVAPRRIITFIIVLVGVLSSIATDAGYLILIPLAAAAFVKLKRHPLAGIAAAFGGVSAVFAVNMLITPLDGMLTEITNEAIHLANPAISITVTANLWFNIASTLLMALLVTVITERMIEPRLGAYDPSKESADQKATDSKIENLSPAAEARGLRYALWAFLGLALLIALLTLIPGAPLHRTTDANGITSDPFLDSIIFIITLLFLAAGIGYGYGADTLKGSNKIIAAIVKTFAATASLILLLLVISQFIALFNYSAIPQLIAVGLADWLEKASIGAVPLMVGFILVILLLDLIIPNSVPKWAIFAPIFVPLFMKLGVEPQTVLAAYRIGDSPLNVITPLMVYFPFIVLVAQRYQKDAGIGSVIAVMLPMAVIVSIVWIVFFVAWFMLGIPLGPGYPVAM